MSDPTLLVIVRHGESVGNVIFTDDSSSSETPNHAFALTENGRAQALHARTYLESHFPPFDAHFCSTFARTEETLRIAVPRAIPIIDSRLNELWRGVWNTLPRCHVYERYPEERAVRAREGEYHYRPPGGQSGQDVDLQIHSFLHDLRAHYQGKRVLVVGHGNWMLLFWRLIGGHPHHTYDTRYASRKYDNCELAIYRPSSLGKLTLCAEVKTS